MRILTGQRNSRGAAAQVVWEASEGLVE
jgi:hypothetical protein